MTIRLRTRIHHLLWVSILALGLVRCGGDDSSTDGGAQTKFERIYTGLLDGCGDCHSVNPTDSLLVGAPPMDSRNDFINLVNQTGADFPNWVHFQGTKANCLDIPFIKPGDSGESLLVAIFDSAVRADMDPCIPSNHIGPPYLQTRATNMLPLLKEWINEGARR